LIFCSAPNENGVATLVGIPGATAQGSVVLVNGEQGQAESFVVHEDGSFAGRIEALEGESLFVMVFGEDGESGLVTILAGTLQWGAVGDAIVGAGGGAAMSNDYEGMVSIQGEGDALQTGLFVVGGNVDLSAGQRAAVSCDPTCHFELDIFGEAGDEIDLFLVREGENSGVTDSQTEIVPGY
jgi:hypothetical protein